MLTPLRSTMTKCNHSSRRNQPQTLRILPSSKTSPNCIYRTDATRTLLSRTTARLVVV
ncbi:hypothetical protein JG688_00012699 [Phytophthora aleatoria]|uniref:Uncharacterized protein n=1 Tax=Phytophthora aleatoria TaxID=2496075 RepID=A0A8J5M1S1_9STRA|nr:hypothetical protein JG688_00012699 [Phytophthora aleatoria]